MAPASSPPPPGPPPAAPPPGPTAPARWGDGDAATRVTPVVTAATTRTDPTITDRPLPDRHPADPDAPQADNGEGDGGDDNPTERRPRWRWALPLTAGLLAVLAVALGSALAGYRWSNSRHQPITAATSAPKGATTTTTAAPAAAVVSVTMPDLYGLDENDAREALSDVGIDVTGLKVEKKPYVGEPGRVVGQEPTRGTSNPGPVTLVLATAATVPNVAGQPGDAAERQLSALGAAVQVESVYDAAVPVGAVVSVSPAVGQPLSEAMVLRISAQPSSVFLSSLDGDGSGCSTGAVQTGSTQSAQGLSCSARSVYEGQAPTPSAVYQVTGRVDRFTATVGIDNGEDPAATARVIVEVDGAERFNQVVRFNQTVAIDVSVTGGAQVRIFVLEVGEESSSATVVFAEATFLGSPTAIDDLSTTP